MRALVLFCILSIGCEKSQPPVPEIENEADDFFGSDILEGSTGAADKDVICAGASESESEDLQHPAVIRGSVFGPPKTSAHWSFPFVSEAHAVPIQQEVPLADVLVELRTVDKIWRETRTDALGRFCLRLPYFGAFGEDVYLRAGVGQSSLRRFAPTSHTAIVSTQSEALFRIVSPMLPLSPGALINAQVIADTSADFSDLKAGADIEKTVTNVETYLRNDPRIIEWMARYSESP